MSRWIAPYALTRRERGDYELRDGKGELVIGGTERECRAKLAEFRDSERRQACDATLRRAIGA